MNKEKIKKAFSKVKEDINYIKLETDQKLEEITKELKKLENEIYNLKSVSRLNEDIKQQIDRLRRLNIDDYIYQLKENYTFIKSINDDFNKRFDSFHMQFNELKEKLDRFSSIASTNSKEITSILRKVEELNKLFNEKIDLEIANLRLEFLKEIDNLKGDIIKEVEKLMK